jgi:glycerate-2-kinase
MLPSDGAASIFRKRKTLIKNGISASNQKARRLCLRALESALVSIDPYARVKAALTVIDNKLVVDGHSIKLSKINRVFLLAVGKASAAMTKAALAKLRGWPVAGILVMPHDQPAPMLNAEIKLLRASHPIPGVDGLQAANKISSSLLELGADDLLICMISGGSSAMLPSPPPNVSLRDEQKLTKLMIHSRATIHEINIVRRHISTLKGGRLVQLCKAKSILSLIISDVPGNFLPDIGSGPTIEDPTTFQQAIEVLEKHGVWGNVPRSVKRHLLKGKRGLVKETPKPGNVEFDRVRNVIIADNATACNAAANALSKKRRSATVLTSRAEIEASQMGKFLASIAVDREERQIPHGPIVIGGESTVLVRGNGIGGRNQELALSSVEGIAGLDGVVIGALGTDGIDGNSKAAGAIVDGATLGRAKRMGLRPKQYLARNDSYNFFRALNDNLLTGRTGTNVGDIYLVVC